MIRLILALWCSALLGCEGAHYQAARQEDSAGGYRRFLARHRQGERAAAARRRLEELNYLDARRVDRPLGYHRYLDELPDGRFAASARKRLAELALARASGTADLLLVLERHPGTPEAAEAQRRLPPVLAREALAAGTDEAAQRFLDRYPASDDAPRVRAHLAALRYARLPDEPLALEAFAESFAGTTPARQALQRLEKLLADEAAGGEPELVEQLRARFPTSARLPALLRLAADRKLRRALAGLDLTALEKIAAEEGEANKLAGEALAWCRPRVDRCRALAELARQAAPYQPGQSLEALRARVYDADLAVAWRSIAALALLEDAGAGGLLVELCGSERFSTVWMAERALLAWLGRREKDRRSWAAAELRRPASTVNDEERQRRGALLLLLGRLTEGEGLLQPLLEKPSRQLVVSFLLLRQARRQGAGASGVLLGRLLSGARARLSFLKDAFPADLQKDSLAAAELAEHELHAVERALADVQGPAAPPAELAELQRTIGQLLAGWRLRLGKARPGYQAAQEPGPDPGALAHERGRAAALKRLRADRSPVARLIAGALCGNPAAQDGCLPPR